VVEERRSARITTVKIDSATIPGKGSLSAKVSVSRFRTIAKIIGGKEVTRMGTGIRGETNLVGEMIIGEQREGLKSVVLGILKKKI
jgi:hypothetical protein